MYYLKMYDTSYLMRALKGHMKGKLFSSGQTYQRNGASKTMKGLADKARVFDLFKFTPQIQRNQWKVLNEEREGDYSKHNMGKLV